MRFQKVSSFVVLLFAFGSLQQVHGTAGDNKQEAGVMCDILHLAEEAELSLRGEPEVPVGKPFVEKIENLNITTSDEEWYSQKEAPGYTAEEWNTKKSNIQETRNGGGLELLRRPSNIGARRTANRRIQQIYREAEEENDRLNGFYEKLNGAVNAAKEAAEEALYGTTKKLGIESFSENRVAGCGGHGSADGAVGAGKSIVNDLTCLCAKGAGGAAGDGDGFPDGTACVRAGAAIASAEWGNAGSGSKQKALTAWQHTRKVCSLNFKGTHPGHLASRIQQALAHFRSLIGNNGNLEFVLGKSNGDNGQCANGHAAAACISYKTQLQGGQAGITWENALKRLVVDLETVESTRKLIQNSLQTLHGLARMANGAYTQALWAETDTRRSVNETALVKEASKVAEAPHTATGDDASASRTYSPVLLACSLSPIFLY